MFEKGCDKPSRDRKGAGFAPGAGPLPYGRGSERGFADTLSELATGEQAAQHGVGDAARRLRFEAVRIEGGWSGRVLVRWEVQDSGTGARACRRPAGKPVPQEPVPQEPVPQEPVPQEPVPQEPVPQEPGPQEPVRQGRPLPDVGQWQALLGPLVENPASMPGYAALKYSDRGEVFRARLWWDGRSLEVVCKQSRARGFLRRLASRWRSSRSRRDFDRALELLRGGIDTPVPMAWIERRGRGRDAWLVAEFVPDLVDLDQVALTLAGQSDRSRVGTGKAAILDAAVNLVSRMERHGWYHRDLKASNLALQRWNEDEGPVRLVLVDLDGIVRRVPSDGSRRWQPLVRLAASLVGYRAVTRTDHCRFLQRYLVRAGLPREDWKPRFRQLAHRVANYVRRAEARKVGKLDGYTGTI